MYQSKNLNTMLRLVIILAAVLIFDETLFMVDGLSTTLKDRSYHDDMEFQKMVQDVLSDLEEDDIHSRILAVNDVHRKYQQQMQQDESEKKPTIDVDENIIETNLEQGVQLFEGDIDLTPEQSEMIRETGTLQRRTAGRQSKSGLWHDRMIPYIIAPSLRRKRRFIKQAVRIFERDTCLRFNEMSAHRSNVNYIYFDMRDGCHSKIGKSYSKRQQLLSLGMGCHGIGTILHEMTHAIGFWHEQAREDRNKYVKVIWENVRPGQEYNFERHDTGSVQTFNLPYDYESIMHYGKISFSRNGGNTLERIDNPKAKLGRSDKGFSGYDKTAINALYECNKYPAGYRGFSSWSKWIGCNWNCKRYRERFCMNAASNPYWRKKLCPGAREDGIHIEYKDCDPSECGPIDGGWSHWGPWTYCSAKCGEGTRTRKRNCNNPTPMHKGKECPGSGTGTGKCSSGKCRLGYYETQFDGNTGSWQSKGTGYFKWSVESYYRNPGPKGDHTSGRALLVKKEIILKGMTRDLKWENDTPKVKIKGQQWLVHLDMYATRQWTTRLSNNVESGSAGKWLYLPTSYSARYKGKKAKLVNTFGWGNPFCLTFYYSMDGPSVGTLSVVIRIKMRNDKRSWSVFTARGSKGRDWHRGVAFIDVKDKNFEISFEGSGNGVEKQGVIALDDIYISKHCPAVPTVKPTVPPCIDINLKCEQWAYEGECSRRPKYTKKFCRKSCFCKPVKCVDTAKYKDKCSGWADKDECDKNPVWMRKNCCVSCRLAKACPDTDKKNCPKWAKKGACKKNRGWMKKNCCKSCQKVGYERPCNNKNENCARWAKKSECTKNAVWMINNCCKSCRGR